jgi:hypothetical protein
LDERVVAERDERLVEELECAARVASSEAALGS